MTSIIGCAGLIFIFLFIILLYILRKKNDNKVINFYAKNNLRTTENFPATVRVALGEANWQCFDGSLHGKIPFHWWRGFTKSTVSTGATSQVSLDFLLAVSFPPNTISEDFVRQAVQFADQPHSVKDFFVLDTFTPVRVEKLTDGSLLLVWKTLDRADDYQKKLDWLQTNVTPFVSRSPFAE